MIKTYKNLKGLTWNQSDIPKWIFRTGSFKIEELPAEIVNLYEKTLIENEGYELFYFDDDDRLDFIKSNYDSDVVDAYLKLLPKAYQVDLFRYLLLYKYGGVYMDFSMMLFKKLDDIIGGYKHVYCKDADNTNNTPAILNGFIITIKNSYIIKDCIDACLNNIKNRYKGESPLGVTGPILVGSVFSKYDHLVKDGEILTGDINGEYLVYYHDDVYIKDSITNDIVSRARLENHYLLLYNTTSHYSTMWKNDEIYKNNVVFKGYKDIKGKVWEGTGIPKWFIRSGAASCENLPGVIVNLYTEILNNNPGYDLFYLDDSDCEQFILEEWGQYYLDLYNKLIPTAYKSDFWRYLFLYKYGGCYGDFTQVPLSSTDELISGVDRVFVRDDPSEQLTYLYNALMYVKAKDIAVKRAIEICVHNIENEYYGRDPLCVTGPAVLGQAFKEVGLNKLKLTYDISLGTYKRSRILHNNWWILGIMDGDKKLLTCKLDFHKDILYKNRKHYCDQYAERNVFKK